MSGCQPNDGIGLINETDQTVQIQSYSKTNLTLADVHFGRGHTICSTASASSAKPSSSDA